MHTLPRGASVLTMLIHDGFGLMCIAALMRNSFCTTTPRSSSTIRDADNRKALVIDSNLDIQYNARASVPDYSIYPRLYGELSAQAYDRLPHIAGIQYGPGHDEALDVFPSAGTGAPVFVFVHGGYWRALSKDVSAFVAPALHDAGAVVVVLDYALAPAVTLTHIVDQIRRAIAWVYASIGDFGGDPDRIVVCGSSAGGHLVGMLLAGGWHDRYGVPATAMVGALMLSGLFDITPLLHTHVNEWMRLDHATAIANSPLFQLPQATPATTLFAVHGEHEPAGFIEQSRRYAREWITRGGTATYASIPERNHFDVVIDLQRPGTQVYRAAASLLGLAQPATCL